MLPKEELKAMNNEFWSSFKILMKKFHSSNGRRINWLTYPSDVKHVYIRMLADKNGVRLCFDIQHKDVGIRSIIWEQMIELRTLLDKHMPNQGKWEFNYIDNTGHQISRIYWENKNLNFFNKSDWSNMHMFLKTNIVAFDKFYQEYKEILINLTD